MSRQSVSPCLRLALPKGRMEQAVLTLLGDAGIRIRPGARGYRPEVSLPGTEAKILKPQNIVEMLSLGSRDLGFAGADWVAELEANVVELLDTGLDPVQVVAAAPQELLENGALPARPLVVASEYERLARRWIIDDLVMLLNSVLVARRRVMIEVNASAECLDAVVAVLPSMRRATVAPLFGNGGYAVKAAVPRDALPQVIPAVKAAGGTDVVVSTLSQIVPCRRPPLPPRDPCRASTPRPHTTVPRPHGRHCCGSTRTRACCRRRNCSPGSSAPTQSCCGAIPKCRHWRSRSRPGSTWRRSA